MEAWNSSLGTPRLGVRGPVPVALFHSMFGLWPDALHAATQRVVRRISIVSTLAVHLAATSIDGFMADSNNSLGWLSIIQNPN